MSYEVSSDHPLPDGLTHRGRGRPSKFPLQKLEIGQSFFVPCSTPADKNAVSVSARYFAQKLKRKFTTRSVDGGMRVWRIDLNQTPLIIADIDFTPNAPAPTPAPGPARVAATPRPDTRTAVISTLAAGLEPDEYWLTLDIKGLPPTEHLLAYNSPAFGKVMEAAAARTDVLVRSLDDLPGTRLEVVIEGGRPIRLVTGEPI